MPISRIKSDGIQDEAITSAKIGVDVIAAEDLAANSVTVAEISNGAVTSAKLDTNIDIAGTLDVTGVLTADNNASVAGTLGVGTTSPGAVRLYSLTSTDGNLAGQFENSHATGSYGIVVKAGSGSGNYTADFRNKDNTTLMRIRGDGNVGIGTNSPGAKIHSVDSNGNVLRLQRDGAFTGSWDVDIGTVTTGDFTIYDNENSKRAFTIEKLTGFGGTSALYINSSGKLLINRTSTVGYQLDVYGDVKIERAGTSATHLVFTNANGNVGTITTSGTSTAYNTSSDYRLKENIADLTGAIDRVKQVPVHRFNFITDPDNTVDGFIAHEVADIVPEAITGEKDAVNDEGNPVYQGIDQSKLVPLLTAALQEAVAKIEALETRIAVLESA